MKKSFSFFLSILFFMLFVNCEKDLSPFEDMKFFHPGQLSQLLLDHIDDFWQDDTIKSVEHPIQGIFSRDPGLINGYLYLSRKGKIWSVCVFESKDIAIRAMEERIKEVSALIYPGDYLGDLYDDIIEKYWSKHTTKKIRDRWWWGIYGFGSIQQRFIFINKYNTIIEVSNLRDDLSDSSRVLLEDTAIELARRVDELSK